MASEMTLEREGELSAKSGEGNKKLTYLTGWERKRASERKKRSLKGVDPIYV